MQKKFKLRDNHPIVIKYNKLVGLAEDLGIQLYFQSGNCVLVDTETREEYRIEDLEEGLYKNPYVDSFPAVFEVKIIRAENMQETIE